ncbi:MAG TPA: efflux RND transporter periplasmic adaptor subunit [Chthoniobacterales bacterium]|jgi:RND family efflux transporter MFP subunit|nr:efflux RND transporter periplasmic adaptor subunit [Chthoniobacterales bacterium]
MDRREFFQAALKTGLVAVAGLGVFGCGQKPASQAPPPPTVTVAKPVKKEIVEWLYFTAQTQAIDTVTITPRVTGYIDNITFKEGDIIDFGDLLFVIDPRPYQAALDQAKGQLEQAQAQEKLNDANLERANDLLAKKVIAKQDYDTTAAQKYVGDAQVVASQAALESAQLNLDFTQIRSPIHGKIGAQLVNRGNLVQANATQLTTIVSIDPIYAYFYVDERSVLRYQESVKAGKMPAAKQATLPVWLQLENEQGYPHAGVIDFINNSFDPSTGTLQLRGRFPNLDGFLLPGAFGSVRVAGSPKYEAVLVADRAIGSDQDQKYVVVVQADGLTKFQKVVLGPIADGLRVIQSGLQGDETVVVEGIGKVRPNSKVSAEQTDMNKFATEQLAMETHVNAGSAENAVNAVNDQNRLSAAMPKRPASNGKHE